MWAEILELISHMALTSWHPTFTQNGTKKNFSLNLFSLKSSCHLKKFNLNNLKSSGHLKKFNLNNLKSRIKKKLKVF